MLQDSVSDLQSTMCELQERLHSVDGEGECVRVCVCCIYRNIYTLRFMKSLTASCTDGTVLDFPVCVHQEMNGRRGMRHR